MHALSSFTHLVNELLKVGLFPMSWKTSIVRTLPKIKNPSRLFHLRPLFCATNKMSIKFEKVSIRQIIKHIKEEWILTKLKSGLRTNYKTCTALTNMFADFLRQGTSFWGATGVTQLFVLTIHRLLVPTDTSACSFTSLNSSLHRL